MDLEDYWGIGPKTRDRLEEALGTERAIEAIETIDIPALTEAGLARGRATRVLRHAHGERGMDLLRTPDTRRVYKDLIDRIAAHALTKEAADRIRVLTPLASIEDMDARLDDVALARESWAALDEPTREAVLDVFEAYDAADGGERAAVAAALSLREAGVERGVFEPLTDLDREGLAAARDALRYLDGEAVLEGADADLDTLRERRAATDRLASGRTDVLEAIGADELRTTEEFRAAFVEYATAETGVSSPRIRAATPQEATDAAAFVSEGLRALGEELEEAVAEREREVRADLEESIADARGEVDAAVGTVREITLTLSLARFAAAYDSPARPSSRMISLDLDSSIVNVWRSPGHGTSGSPPVARTPNRSPMRSASIPPPRTAPLSIAVPTPTSVLTCPRVIAWRCSPARTAAGRPPSSRRSVR